MYLFSSSSQDSLLDRRPQLRETCSLLLKIRTPGRRYMCNRSVQACVVCRSSRGTRTSTYIPTDCSVPLNRLALPPDQPNSGSAGRSLRTAPSCCSIAPSIAANGSDACMASKKRFATVRVAQDCPTRAGLCMMWRVCSLKPVPPSRPFRPASEMLSQLTRAGTCNRLMADCLMLRTLLQLRISSMLFGRCAPRGRRSLSPFPLSRLRWRQMKRTRTGFWPNKRILRSLKQASPVLQRRSAGQAPQLPLMPAFPSPICPTYWSLRVQYGIP